MKLEIFDEQDELDYNFGSWLIRQIQNRIVFSLNLSKLQQWDEFFEENPDYQSLYDKKIQTRDILLFGAKSLVCDKIPQKLIIRLNRNQFVPGLDRVRVDTVVRLITFGNTSIKGYPIFIDVLTEVAENINFYVDLYEKGFV